MDSPCQVGSSVLSFSHSGLGIRTFREINSGLLAKLVWLMVQEGDVLWARILRKKYAPYASNFTIFVLKPHAFVQWRSLTYSRDSLQRVPIWRLVMAI